MRAQNFIKAITKARPLPVSSNRYIHSLISNPRSWKPILILSTHLRLCCSSCLLHLGFLNSSLYAHLLSTMRATKPTHLFLLCMVTGKIFDMEWNSSIFSSKAENFLFSETSRSSLGSAHVKHASPYRPGRQLSFIQNYKVILSNNLMYVDPRIIA